MARLYVNAEAEEDRYQTNREPWGLWPSIFVSMLGFYGIGYYGFEWHWLGFVLLGIGLLRLCYRN